MKYEPIMFFIAGLCLVLLYCGQMEQRRNIEGLNKKLMTVQLSLLELQKTELERLKGGK
tara:strand:+ start:245 stop:421 length:177 start_codon:yes stop_codon:yes gene_type:complete